MPRYQQFFQFVGVGLPFLGLPLAIWEKALPASPA